MSAGSLIRAGLRDGRDAMMWTAIVVAFSLVVSLSLPPTADIAWRHHVAAELLSGRAIYVDVIEVNPPLWFWASVPGVAFAQATGLSPYAVLCLTTHATVLVAAGLFLRLCEGLVQPGAARWLGPAFAAATLLLAWGEMGQREQALGIACLLWTALAARRIEGLETPAAVIAASAALAAYGFALKHFFVLVPVAVELWLIVAMRRRWRPFRLETLILGGAALAYAGAVVLAVPDFLSRVVPLVGLAYNGFGPWNGVEPWLRPWLIAAPTVYVLAPPVLAWLAGVRSRLVWALIAVSGLLVVIVVLQQKGWRYHNLGAQAVCVMCLVLIAVDSVTSRRLARLCALTAGALVVVLTGVSTVQAVRFDGTPVDPDLSAAIRAEPAGARIQVLSTAPERAFYGLNRAGRTHWSRHYSMWMMPGLLTPVPADPLRDAARLAELSRTRAEFAEDIRCSPPDLLITEAGVFRNPDPRDFDSLAVLKSDPAFAAWFDANYRKDRDIGAGMTAWRPKAARPADLDCARRPRTGA